MRSMGGIMKKERLRKSIASKVREGACVAFSGGVDSSLILKIAMEEAEKLGKKVHAVTFETKLHPVSDVTISGRVAEEMGAIHTIIEVDEFKDNQIMKNPVNRCYLCKKLLFTTLREFAENEGLGHVLDGTNADDHGTYRPGIQALKELSISSPLAENGFTKEEVREYASELGISVSKRPSAPCLATRLPYGTEIDFSLLKRIEEGEEYIRSLGFEVVRVRVHSDIARIEVPATDFTGFISKREEIREKLKSLGFNYITLDVEGFRSGSMDLHLNNK
ncbi:ATP-dependent sacrificial sulfur transferase LarE [Proteiniclasticum sp. SCR006]|uniref:ATP-dependent sacrificial sulfur transferase LarE n=2 Tax=Proteiniclasticum aestuarii TaxID=2817862 RepID=A0A939H982_9CLOT|nr:ATP-dependent sacrificial sulfur transferase LarE [Proteiniclasticum aestuarii]